MAEVVETLIVRIEGDLADLRKDLKKSGTVVKAGAEKMSRSADKATKSFGGLGVSALKLAATVGVVGLAFKSLKDIFAEFTAVDVLAKTADRLGLTTEALVGLQFAAGQTGVEGNVLATSLQRLNRRLAEVAATGGGTAKKSLDALGLSAKQLLKLPLEEQFGLIADRLNEVSSQADKTKIAFGFFDTEGGKLLNTLRVGSEGLAEFRKEAEALGIAISRVDAAKIEAANDTLDRLAQTFIGASRAAAVQLAPAIDFVAGEFVKMNKNAGEGSAIIDTLAKAIIVGFRLAQKTVAGFNVIIDSSILAFGQIEEAALEGSIIVVKAFRRMQAGGTGIVIVAVNMADAFLKAFNFIGNIATNTWALVTAGADIVASEILIVFEAAAAGVTSIVQGIKVAFAEALKVASVVVAAGAGFIKVREGLSADLINAAGDLELAVLRERNAAESGVEAAKAVLDKSVTAFKDATANLLTTEAPGSELFRQISDDLEDLARAQLNSAEQGDAVTESLTRNLALIRQSNKEAGEALDKSLQEAAEVGTIEAALQEFEQLKSIREAAFAAEIEQREAQKAELAAINSGAAAQEIEQVLLTAEQVDKINQGVRQREAAINQQRLAAGRQFLSDLATLTQSESRKAFEVGKAAALAEAGVNTFLAATKAYQALAGIPVVGPGLGAAAAAAAIAAGLVNIQRIRQMQFGGGAAASGGGVAPSPATSGGGGGAGGAPQQGGGGPIQSQQFNITLQGERFTGDQIRKLIESINDQLGDNATLQVG